MGIAWETALLAAICGADLTSTLWLLGTSSAQEANPILRFYLQAGVICFVGAKMLLNFGPLYVLEVLRRREPGLIQLVLRGAIALYLLCYGIAVWRTNAGGRSPSQRAALISSARRFARLADRGEAYAPDRNTLPRLKIG